MNPPSRSSFKSPNFVRHLLRELSLLLIFAGLPASAQEAPSADPSGDEKAVTPEGVSVSDREKVELVENSDVAESVERRPDLQFRNVTIDGEKATVDLSEIPADSVLSAEVSKAATPDLDADTRGSGLNLRSKPTYDLDGRLVESSLSFRYSPYVNTQNTEASFTYGQPMDRSGFIFTVAVEDGTRAEDNYGQGWDMVPINGQEEFVLKDQSLRYGENTDRELNLNMTYDFRINGHIRFYFKADGEYEERESFHPRFSLRYEDSETVSIDDQFGIVSDATSRRVMGGGSFENKAYTLSTGAYIDYDAYSIDYFISYQSERVLEPDWLRAEFILEPVDIRYDWTVRHSPTFEPLEGEASLEEPENFQFSELRQSSWEEANDEWIARLNAQVPFQMGSWTAAIKGGAKVRYLDSSIDADMDVHTGYDGTFTIADVLSQYTNNDLLNDRYSHGPFPSIALTRQYFSDNENLFEYDETRSRELSDPNTWTVNQQISAGYLMGYLSRGKLRAILGLRAEQTNMSYDAFQLETDELGNYLSTIPVSDESSYNNIFPGIHGRYDLNDRLSIIGSWTHTIQRPHYGSLVPRRTIDHEDKYIQEGNPGLDPTLFTNFNAAIDYKLKKGSTLSVEMFLLELEDTVFFEVIPVTEGPFTGYDLGSNSNGPSAEAKGTRLIWNQALEDWWSMAEGFRFSANYTWQTTETEYPSRPGETHPMTGYADQNFELILTYEKSQLFAQISFDYHGESLSWIQEETWRDNYRMDDLDIDYSMSWRLGENFRVILDVNNIIEQRRHRTYRGDPSRPGNYEWGARFYKLELRYTM